MCEFVELYIKWFNFHAIGLHRKRVSFPGPLDMFSIKRHVLSNNFLGLIYIKRKNNKLKKVQ